MPPRFSVLTPVADPPAAVLTAAIDSVRHQTFGDWELCLITDGCSAATRSLVDKAAAGEPRIRCRHRDERGGIVAATNDALGLATGEFVAFLDHDDELARHALEAVHLRVDDEVDYVYSDEDRITASGRQFGQFLKPDWSPERLRAQMYTCHLSVLRRSLVEELGGMRAGFDGSQDWDLVLRATERARKVVHVPDILYHWRVLEGSAAGDPMAKDYALAAAVRAVGEHLDRIGLAGTVSPHPKHPGFLQIEPALRDRPLVSIIIPTRGAAYPLHGSVEPMVSRCVQSLMQHTDYRNFEIVCVADTETPSDVLAAVEGAGHGRVRLVSYDRPFNFAEKINLGVFHARGDYLLFLNDDTEVLAPQWLDVMVMYAQLADVGAVGAKLLYADRRVQHVGVHCIRGAAVHHYSGITEHWEGYFGNVVVPTNYLAVTAACMLTRRDCFNAAGGLSAEFPVNFNDVDYCLKLRHLGYRTVYAPNAVLFHYESATRKAEVAPEELELLYSRWRSLMWGDPYYNVNFQLTDKRYVLNSYLPDGTVLPPDRLFDPAAAG